MSPLLITILAVKATMILGVIFPLGLASFGFYFLKLSSMPVVNLMIAAASFVLLVAAWKFFVTKFSATRFLVNALVLYVVLEVGFLIITGDREPYSLGALRWAAQHVVVLFSVLRWDILFVLFLAVICLAGLSRWPTGDGAVRIRRLAILIQVPLVLVSSLELAYYLKTGVTGSSQLFTYAVTHGPDIWPIVKSELDWILALVIIAPLFAIAYVAKVALPSCQLQAGASDGHNIRRIGPFIWPVFLLLIIVPGLNSNAHYFQFEQNIHSTILSESISSSFANNENDGFIGFAETGQMLFDTRQLKLVPTPASTRSNVILVILESAGVNATSVYDGNAANTPFLKKFSANSMVVEEMYVVVPRTLASWISVLQGVYPAASKLTTRWGDRLEQEGVGFASLPELLRPYGYKSAFFTPTHLDYENERQLIANIGFDDVVSKRDYQPDGFEIVNYFGWEDRIMTQPILDWVDNQSENDAPIFLTVMTNVGHHDYNPPSSWPMREYDTALGEQHNDYLNSLAYIDSFLRDLFADLEKRRVFDDSLVIIVGDHGESFGEHGKNHHMAVMYEESLHVPAIIHSTSTRSQVRSIPGLWQLPDIFPTIIDLLGYEISGGRVAGTSLLGNVPKARRIFFAGSLDNSYLGMREGSLKYVYYFGRRPMEVYDIDVDREEKNDLGGMLDEETARQIENDIKSWYRSVSSGLSGKYR